MTGGYNPPAMSGNNPAKIFNGSAAAMAISATLLGMALQVNDGLFAPAAAMLLALAFAVCLAGAFLKLRPVSEKWLAWLLAGLTFSQMIAMFFHRAGASEATVPSVDHRPFFIGVCVAIAAVALIITGSRRVMIVGFVALMLSFSALGIWKLRAAPDPQNDVVVVHHEAAHALAKGINPYTITFPNIYGPDAYVYPREVMRDGRILFGYPYPPLMLVSTASAQNFLGDFRYAQLLAMVATGLLLVMIRPGRVGMLAAALLMFTPRSFYVLETGWTEPINVALLTLATLGMARQSRWLPAALGVLAVSKQYLPAIVLMPNVAPTPALPRSTGRVGWRVAPVMIAILSASAVTLPLVLWDVRAFWHSVFEVQFAMPYRADALNFMAWWGSFRPGWIGPAWLGFAALFVTLAAAHRRRLRFTAAFVVCYFAFFAFGKQAFANYYFFLIGAMACDICLGSTEESAET